jgi:hypothetical protein
LSGVGRITAKCSRRERPAPSGDGIRDLDRRKAIMIALRQSTPKWWEAADAELNAVWVSDARAWPLRLSSPFLQGLTQQAVNAFTGLVTAGCQPDMLALRFQEATQVEEHSKDQDRVRADLEELKKLTEQAVQAVAALAHCRRQFDEYLEAHRLRVLDGEPGDAELKILRADFEDLAARHQADYQRLRQQSTVGTSL